MKVLQNDSHESLLEYLFSKGIDAIRKINESLDGVKTLEDWKLLEKRLLEDYKSAYPSEMFFERGPVEVKKISSYVFTHYKIENYLFESFPGWYVNASVYSPLKKGKYPGIVCPTGHSTKKNKNYTGSAQLLARSGYVAVSFDPPGMKGEHQNGNDHFEDGVRGYLSGFWTQAFFVMDAIRCLDYLETRDDVIKKHGFAMTGISGGGITTIHSAVLDKRITCVAPVCCISDEEVLMFRDRYTFCPEGKGWGHIKNGIRYRTLLSLVAPIPCLVVSGVKDEVFNCELAEENVRNVSKIYDLYKNGSINFYADENAGHEYTPDMVNKVLEFFDEHIKGIKEKKYNYTYEDIEYPEEHKVLCHPKDSISMYTVNLAMFKNAKKRVQINRGVLAEYLKLERNTIPIDVITPEKPLLRWVHSLGKRIYVMDEFIKLPALVLERDEDYSDEVLIYADDVNKWDKFENDGFLTKKAYFLNRAKQNDENTIISVELSGIGELSIEASANDLAGWSRTERLLSYVAITLDESITAIRTREFLAVLNETYGSGRYVTIKSAGKGLSSLPVLLASYIFGKCRKVILENLPVSFESMAEKVPNVFCPTSVIFNAPRKFEIYEIAYEMRNLTLVNPIYADGVLLPYEEALKYFGGNVEIIYTEKGLSVDIL